MKQGLQYCLTLNLITGCLLEEWTIDLGNGPIWESECISFPTKIKDAADLQARHMCIGFFKSKKYNHNRDSRDLYKIIK